MNSRDVGSVLLISLYENGTWFDFSVSLTCPKTRLEQEGRRNTEAAPAANERKSLRCM
jgi:hypothetical protein